MMLPQRERVGAWLLLLGTTCGGIGMAWDVQWHSDVGPDTFFTAPHLVMYLGGAISGITSLAVVLLATRAAHRSEDVDGMPALTVLRTFRAPLPYLICGTANAVGLLYGLTDLWWHEVYGFDVTPKSPPHVAMSMMSLYDSVGVMLAFILLRSTRAGRAGLVTAAAVIMPNLVFLCYSTPPLPSLDTAILAIVAVGIIVIAAVGGALRRPGPVAAIAASLVVSQGLLWLTIPLATELYADSLGLGLRDFAVRTPILPITSPLALPLGALAFAAGLRYARRWSPRAVTPLLGAIAAVVAAAGYFLVPSLPISVATAVAAAPVGAVAAWLGWVLGSLARTESADAPATPPPGPVAATRLAGSEA